MGRRKNYELQNTLVFHDYYSRLKTIALSMFEWHGLPDSCNARFLEWCLFHYGRAIFVDDADMGILNLKANPSDIMNVYNEPTAYEAWSINYSKMYKAEDCCLVRNNYLEKPTDTSILLFAERLAKIQLAAEVNIWAQRTPVLIHTDDKTAKSMEVLYDQFDGNRPLIVVNKTLDTKPLECISTGAPFVADKLREEKLAVWNEALESLGLNTNPSDKKKERLIISEVESNNEQIDMQAEAMLLCRQAACDRMNEMWGLDVSVELRVQKNRDAMRMEQEVDDIG